MVNAEQLVTRQIHERVAGYRKKRALLTNEASGCCSGSLGKVYLQNNS
jgi:hypothetical protein